MIGNILWLVLCIYFEARGEPLEGKIAVGHVILNRVERRDASVKEIVKAPWQFSWLNPGMARPELNDLDALESCAEAAMMCLAERLAGKDFWQADHYHAIYVKPSWAPKLKKVGQIGRHIFYRS